jgi:hypothetical protein
MTYYVKPMSGDVLRAMENLEGKIEAQTAAQALRDSDRTLNAGSGATLKSVN